jgi:hypothetical protein
MHSYWKALAAFFVASKYVAAAFLEVDPGL